MDPSLPGKIFFPEEVDVLFRDTELARQNSALSQTRVFASTPENKELLGKRIGILGAGIAGLSLALSLQKCGFRNVAVFEKDGDFSSRPQGYSFTLQQSMAFLNEIGIGEEISNSDLRQEKRAMYDWNGNLLYQEPHNARKRWSIPVARQTLRKMFLERLQNGTVHWGKSLADLRSADHGDIDVSFHTGETERLAALVVCEGGWSQTRRLLIDRGLLRAQRNNSYTGLLMINGIADIAPDADQFYNRELQFFNGHTRIFIKPFDAGRAMWQVTYPEHVSRSPESIEAAKEKVRALIQGWPRPVRKLVDRTNADLMRVGHLFDRTPDTEMEFSIDNVTIAGDAAHFMTPFMGQGANNALWDTRDIVESISTHRTFNDSFRHYERKMLDRSRYFVYRSRELTHFSHTGDVLDPGVWEKRHHPENRTEEKMKTRIRDFAEVFRRTHGTI